MFSTNQQDISQVAGCLLDMFKISRLRSKPMDMVVQILHPLVQLRIIVPNHADIALEVLH